MLVALLPLLPLLGCDDDEDLAGLQQVFDGILAFDAEAFHPFTARRDGTAELTLFWTEPTAGLVLALVRGECDEPDFEEECDFITSSDPFPPPGTGQAAELAVAVEGGERYTIVVDYFTSIGGDDEPPELPTTYGVNLAIE